MNAEPNKHIIWSSDINLDDWKNYITENVRPNFPEADDQDIDTFIDKHFSECYQSVSDTNNDYLDDVIANLGGIDVEGDIIVIGDLGTWHGRVEGFKYEGNNINSIFHSNVNGQSDITFYVEKEGRTLDLKAREAHHDGVNHYLYREIKPNISDAQREKFENLLYEGKADYATIAKYTRPLGQEVQKVYGFKLTNEKNTPVKAER